MNLKEKLKKDIVAAMKAKEKEKLIVLRMLKGNIQNQELNKREDLTDVELLAAVSKEIKTRKESIAEFEKGGRSDLIEANMREIEILNVYLPEQISSEELVAIINEEMAKVEKTPRNMGVVIKAVGARVAGQADMKEVSKIVKEKINS